MPRLVTVLTLLELRDTSREERWSRVCGDRIIDEPEVGLGLPLIRVYDHPQEFLVQRFGVSGRGNSTKACSEWGRGR